MLEFVLERVGAGKITRKRTTSAEHAPSFTYAIWNRQALELLRQIAPHLQSYKRKRAKHVLENYVRLTPATASTLPNLQLNAGNSKNTYSR